METLVFDKVRVIKSEPTTMKQSIERVMTSDHYVYVVHAGPDVVQPFHHHATDWSLIVVSGMMTLTADGVPYDLVPGDTLLLPAKVVHSSHAGPEGCTFLEVEAENAVGLVKEEDDRWKQFFINDQDESFSTVVSFNDQVKNGTWQTEQVEFDKVRMIKGEPTSLEQAILKGLPVDHFVAVMNDSPGFIHHEHQHRLDEILYIVHGKLTVTANEQTFELTSGDRLLLPANTVHVSVGGSEGCVYQILKLDEKEHYTIRL